MNFDINKKISINDIKQFQQAAASIRRGTSLFEFSMDNFRFDQITIWAQKEIITIYEFKSCRRDFESDKKWQCYLKYCNKFIFVCPYNVIEKSDIPKEIGLYYVFKWKPKNWTWEEWKNWEGRKYDTKWISFAKNRNMNRETYIRVINQMITRARYRKEDLF